MSASQKQIDFLKKILRDPFAETIEGVIAVGEPMTPEMLSLAYNHGIFPWPHEGYPLLWFCPDERGVIDFEELHVSRSFQKWLRHNQYKFEMTQNQAFAKVMHECRSQKRAGQKGSWITNQIEKNYQQLFENGGAFSLEVWREKVLVGGIYGVKSEKYYSCESMFHKEDNTSKLALYWLIQLLKKQGHSWMDIQMVTSVCESFGGKLIPKKEFLERIGFVEN